MWWKWSFSLRFKLYQTPSLSITTNTVNLAWLCLKCIIHKTLDIEWEINKEIKTSSLPYSLFSIHWMSVFSKMFLLCCVVFVHHSDYCVFRFSYELLCLTCVSQISCQCDGQKTEQRRNRWCVIHPDCGCEGVVSTADWIIYMFSEDERPTEYESAHALWKLWWPQWDQRVRGWGWWNYSQHIFPGKPTAAVVVPTHVSHQ